jgi:branched-chain amino acid transport system substrate-binding protein
MRMRTTRTWATLVTLGALVLAVMVVAGCSGGSSTGAGGGGTSTPAIPSVVKIGVETGLTGALPDYGYTAAEGAKLAAKDLNAKGVTIGGTKVTIEIVAKDDKADPSEAPVVAQSFIDEGVSGIVGPLTSGCANAVGPIYSKANMPQITASATNATLGLKGWKNFFRDCVSDNIQGKALADWVKELGFKKLVVMDDSGDYSVGLSNVILQNATGLQTLKQSSKDTDTDFSAQIANIKQFAPDVIIYTGYHQEAGLLRKQLVEAGLGKIQFMGGDGIKSVDFAKEAGGAPNANGVLCTVGAFGTADPSTLPGYAKFKADYTAQTGKAPSTYSEGNYDAVGCLVAAMEQAGSVDHAAVIKALGEIQYTGILGTFGFDPATGEMVGKGASANVQTIFRYKNNGTDFLPTK